MTKDINELTTVWYETPNNEEIAKLRAEVEHLKAESDISDGLLADAKAEIMRLQQLLSDTAQAEIERLVDVVAALHREIERLFSLWNPKP